MLDAPLSTNSGLKGNFDEFSKQNLETDISSEKINITKTSPFIPDNNHIKLNN